MAVIMVVSLNENLDDGLKNRSEVNVAIIEHSEVAQHNRQQGQQL